MFGNSLHLKKTKMVSLVRQNIVNRSEVSISFTFYDQSVYLLATSVSFSSDEGAFSQKYKLKLGPFS